MAGKVFLTTKEDTMVALVKPDLPRNNNIRALLEDIMNESGKLLPTTVLDYARDPASPLHKYFEWDDTEAAEQYRIDQARQLIRSVSITVSTPVPVQMREFVSLASDRGTKGGGGYRSTMDVMSKKKLRHQLAADIFRQVEMWEARARVIKAAVDFRDTKNIAKRLAK